MILNNVDLNKLKCFQAVAEKGSLLEGAKALNLTTSAVYQSIKRLEGEMEKHLFFRSGKKYILTDEGRALQELYQRFLWDLSEFQDKSKTHKDALSGEIRVGLPLHFSKSLFIPLMSKFQAAYPRVKFHLSIGETHRLIDQILNFELDFSITDDSIPQESFSKISAEEVFKEELVLVCSKDFYLEHHDDFKTIKTMKELPHLDYYKNMPLIQRWYRLYYKRQVKVELSHTIDNVETMVEALRRGLGLGIIPNDLLKESALARDLQVISTHVKLHNGLVLVQEGNYINNNLMKKFINFLRSELRAK
jgi:DNA-binding transcriptional LysR family regulator